MTFLIDGYNLLFRMGYATKKSAGSALDGARKRMLDMLAEMPAVRQGAARVRVVFDAVHGPFASGPSHHKNLIVEFSYRRTADDAIDELVQSERLPHTLTVVSDDTAVRENARRVRVRALTLAEFLDWSEDFEPGSGSATRQQPPEKPDGPVADDEAAEFLRAFGGA